ncbi:unnamed protein product [Brachionus calyciflorus]|uniref:Ion transport domain-containing protein n=1 Tax=Brachionus calyciflorus TaxID=104777 RepID=A0A813YZ57_9BILA|nr:unnamed protein product [Brachionus calyciflorus]
MSKLSDRLNLDEYKIYNQLSQTSEFEKFSNIQNHNIKKQKKRCDFKFYQKCSSIVQSSLFDGFIMTIIILNSIVMGIETLYTNQNLPLFFRILNEFFTCVYTMEFLLKIYVKNLAYFKSLWNWFDFINLIIAYIDISLDLLNNDFKDQKNSFTILRAMRSFKAFRTLRAVSFVRGLQVILSALINTLSNSVINVIIVILLIMFIFSIIANSLFQNDDWSSLGKSMWTLFRYICADEWPEIQKNIDHHTGSRIFTIFFVFIGNFIFANIFIGLIIMNISEAQESHEKILEEQKLKLIREKKENILKKQADELSKLLKKHSSNQFVTKNFSDLIKAYYESLSHSDDLIKPRKLCTNLTWLKSFLKTCKIMEEQFLLVKNLHFEMVDCLSALIEERLSEEKKNLNL